MKREKIELFYGVYSIDELNEADRQLIDTALEATRKSYAPYSRFHVGAAVRLENGLIVSGNNQENVAYPSGLCAERTALFYANSQYPDQAVMALAVAARTSDDAPYKGIITPCGACRQVILETEKRFAKPIRILMCGENEVYIVESANHLLPFAFDNY